MLLKNISSIWMLHQNTWVYSERNKILGLSSPPKPFLSIPQEQTLSAPLNLHSGSKTSKHQLSFVTYTTQKIIQKSTKVFFFFFYFQEPQILSSLTNKDIFQNPTFIKFYKIPKSTLRECTKQRVVRDTRKRLQQPVILSKDVSHWTPPKYVNSVPSTRLRRAFPLTMLGAS